MTITKISMKFRTLMSRDNVNGTLKLLKNNISNRILPLTDAKLQLRKQKHPDSREPPLKVLVEGPIRRIHPVVYDDIDECLILKAATLTKGGSGPSGLDADELCRILTSREYGTSSTDLRKTFAQRIKRLCIEGLETTTSLDAFTACRLILLDKKPGLQPIGVGEVLRRIPGKVIMVIFKKDIADTAGPLQLSAGQETGAGAAIHAIQQLVIYVVMIEQRKSKLCSITFRLMEFNAFSASVKRTASKVSKYISPSKRNLIFTIYTNINSLKLKILVKNFSISCDGRDNTKKLCNFIFSILVS